MEELRTGMKLTKLEILILWIFFILVLQATGDRPTDEDALEMIAEADIDGDGRSKLSPIILLTTNLWLFFS